MGVCMKRMRSTGGDGARQSGRSGRSGWSRRRYGGGDSLEGVACELGSGCFAALRGLHTRLMSEYLPFVVWAQLRAEIKEGAGKG